MTTTRALEHWPIERFRPYDNNPRINDHAVDKLAGAIREFGFRVPMVARSDGTVVDGHLRLKAAQRLGLAELPVLLADDMTPAQIKAFRISVNRMAELAEWDYDMLAVELDELSDIDFDLDALGFDDEELDRLSKTEPVLTERTERLRPVSYTRMLVSVPVGAAIAVADEFTRQVQASGGRIDYAGN